MASLVVFASTAWYSCRGKPESPAEPESPYTEPYDPPSGTPGPGNGTGPSDPAREMALQEAALNGDTDLVRVLLEYGADPSLKDVDGDNAYIFALQNGHTEVAELLKPD